MRLLALSLGTVATAVTIDASQQQAALSRQGADLADALLGEINREKACTTTITFDRRAAEQLQTFTLLDIRLRRYIV